MRAREAIETLSNAEVNYACIGLNALPILPAIYGTYKIAPLVWVPSFIPLWFLWNIVLFGMLFVLSRILLAIPAAVVRSIKEAKRQREYDRLFALYVGKHGTNAWIREARQDPLHSRVIDLCLKKHGVSWPEEDE